MNRPTRQQQAQAILQRRARRMASDILGRHAVTSADFGAAFNLEWIDLIAEVPDHNALMALGGNIVGPKDGLYVLDDEGTYRVYVQERGISRNEVRGASFDSARDAAVERILLLGGLPFRPPG